MASNQQSPDLVRRNIDRVLRLEQHASQAKGPASAISDLIGRFVGTLAFVVIHSEFVAVWISWNTGIFKLKPFDPYPFNLLSLWCSCEAVILTAFVLMKQNRESRLADRRDHLDLQVNLMAEQEASMIIQMLDRISKKLEIPQQENQERAMELSKTATLEHLVEQLHARFPDNESDLPRD